MKTMKSYRKRRKKKNFRRQLPKGTDRVQDQDQDHPGLDQGLDLVPGPVPGLAPGPAHDQSLAHAPDLDQDQGLDPGPVQGQSLDHARAPDHVRGRDPDRVQGHDRDPRRREEAPDRDREVLMDLAGPNQGLVPDRGPGVDRPDQRVQEVAPGLDRRLPTAPDRGHRQDPALQLGQEADQINGGCIQQSRLEFHTVFFSRFSMIQCLWWSNTVAKSSNQLMNTINGDIKTSAYILRDSILTVLENHN